MKLCTLILVCLMCQISMAQDPYIDSLTKALAKSKPDTNRINTLHKLAESFSNYDITKSSKYADEALVLAKKLKNTEIIAKCYGIRGEIDENQGNYTTAINYYEKGLAVLRKFKNTESQAKLYNNLGICYRMMADYTQAVKYATKALQIHEINKDLFGIAIQYNLLGAISLERSENKKAETYFLKALQIGKQLNHSRLILTQYANLGGVYTKTNKCQKAIYYYDLSTKMAETNKDTFNMVIAYGNKGSLLNAMGDTAIAHQNRKLALDKFYPEAIQVFEKCIVLLKKINNVQFIGIYYGNLGLACIHTGEYAKAELNIAKSLECANQLNDMYGKMDSHVYYSELYEAKGQYDKAKEYFRKYQLYKDSIFNEEKNAEITKTELTYEFEKKQAATKAINEKKQAVATTERKKQQLLLILFAAIAMGIAALALIIFRSLRLTRSQKKLIEYQKHQVEEKQKEIMDSIHYAKRIQLALLPQTKYIQRKLNELNKP